MRQKEKVDRPLTRKAQKELREENPQKYDLILAVASMVSDIGKMEKYGIVASTLNACEAVSGVMADIANGRANNPNFGVYFDAIRDIMQLCKMINSLVEMKNDLVQSPTVKWDELAKDIW